MASIRTLGLLLGALLCVPAAAAEGIAWRSDPEAAKREAAGSGRLVLLHFSGTFCPPCRMMEHTVFNRTDVAQAVERDYVPVAVDVQKNQALSQQYAIRTIPADVVVTASGQVLNKSVGAKSAQDYVAALSRIAQYARGSAPSGPLSQAGPGNSPLGQPPGSAAPNAPGSQAPFPDGLGAPSPGNSLQASPFAPRVGQQFLLEANSQQTPAGVIHPTATPPGSTPSGPFSAPPSAFGDGVNRGSGALPSWSTASPNMMSPNTASPNTASPNTVLPNTSPSIDWKNGPTANAAPPSGQPFAAAPPLGNSPLSPNPPFNQWPAGAPAFAPQTSSSPPPQPPKLPPLGFDGFCPVTMFHQERWVPGDRRWGVIHEGRLYLFVSPEAKDAFFRDPNRYAPVFSGDDIVVFAETGQHVPGQVRIGAKYPVSSEQPQRTYFFASEQSYQKFNANPMFYLERLRQVLSGGAINR